MTEPGQIPTRVGPYRIERKLGAGGMGVVYLGRDDSGLAAAVKLIRPEYAADPESRTRLRHEVSAARQVPRLCTAQLLAADLEAAEPWVATEYVEGPTLERALRERGQLAGAELQSFAVGTAVALRAIHQHGVIHRDLKPSNILLSPAGPRVIDFGIARIVEADPSGDLTSTGVIVGTPAYLAPERLYGARPTTAVDVFAWASLVGYAANGRPPFGTGDAAVWAILHGEPDLGVLIDPLRSLVAAALAKEPGRRPTAAELVDRLSQSAEEITTSVLASASVPPTGSATAGPPLPSPPPLSPPPPSPPLPSPRPPVPAQPSVRPAPAARRRRTLAGLASVLAAVVALGLAITAVSTVPRILASGLDAGPGPTGGPTSPRPQGEQPLDPTTAPDPSPATTLPPFGTAIGGILNGHTAMVSTVAIGTRDGSPIAVSGGRHGDQSVRVWDLVTMEPLAELTGHTGSIGAVALGELPDGTPIAVSGGGYDQTIPAWDHTVRVWDLSTMEQIGAPMVGHDGVIQSVAIGELDGTPVAVTASSDLTLRVWDLTTREQLGELTGHTSTVYAVAFGELPDGTPIAVSGSQDSTLRVWDLAAMRPLGEPLTGHTATVWTVAFGQRDGAPVAVSGGDLTDQTVRVWDLTTREQIGELTGSVGQQHPVGIATVDGTPIAVTAGSHSGEIHAWNLDTMRPIGTPFPGHRSGVFAVATGELDGLPVAVTGGQDQTVRVWSLALPGR